MITVKRYNPDAAMSISREHAWMRETPEGGHVEYGDYASLFAQFETVKAERDALEVRLRNALTSEQESIQRAHAANQTIDALAVENENQRDWINKCSELWDAGCDLDNLLGLIPETPATDAALAAIEARGVEKAAAELDALSAQSASATTQANFRAAAVYLRAEVLPAIGEAK
ncbi:TPA: hypothetical protein ACGD7M_001673 [Serratia marcescens]